MKKPVNSGKAWTDEEEALLGTMTDREVAAMIGRHPHAVETQRRKRGIASFRAHERKWNKRELALLGTIPDATLAARLGISRRCVLKTRQRRGVKCFSPGNTPKKFRSLAK